MNSTRHAPASTSSSAAVGDESTRESVGRGWALLLMLAITLACVLMGD